MRNFKFLLLLIVTPIIILSCTREHVVRIGFLGSLTGRYSEAGLNGRNGIVLALEELNRLSEQTGIHYDLLSVDNKSIVKNSLRSVMELKEQGAHFIIGPFRSAAAVQIVPYINQEKLLTFSIVAGEIVHGKDDFIISIFPATKEIGEKMADFVLRENKISGYAAIYDVGNKEYSESIAKVFAKRVEQKKHVQTELVGFIPGNRSAYSEIVKTLDKKNIKSVMILANPLDAAIFTQLLRKQNKAIHILLSTWSVSESFIKNAGRAADGVNFYIPYDLTDTIKQANFLKKYRGRFGIKPLYTSVFSYESMIILHHALSEGYTTDSEIVKSRIIKRKEFQGVQGPVTFNEFGDVKRELFLFTIENGQFKRLE